MMLRRLVVGVVMMSGFSAWSWSRTEGTSAHAAPANPVCSADAPEECGGNRDDAARRFRTNQPHHWKHVVVGLH